MGDVGFLSSFFFFILALNCILYVSSHPKTIFSAFADYDDMYRDCLKVKLPTNIGPKKEEKPEPLIKEERNVILDFLEEMVQEINCVEFFLKKYKDNIEKLAVVLYMKYLTNHYAVEASVKGTAIVKSSNDSEEKTLIEYLQNIVVLTQFYQSYPTYDEILSRVVKLHLQKDRPEETEKRESKEDDENVEINLDDYKNDSFVTRLLPHAVVPSKGEELSTPMDGKTIKALNDRINSLGLLDKSFDMEKGSRINKIMQVLMESDGFHVIPPERRPSDVTPEASTSELKPEADTSESKPGDDEWIHV